MSEDTPIGCLKMQSALVRSILERFDAYEWTAQGFGFVRTKIADVGRIHVWAKWLAETEVSSIHTHPWPLRSTIISGELLNHRFTEHEFGALPYFRSRIATGEGGGLVGDAVSVFLSSGRVDVCTPGDVYSQTPEEIHRTLAEDGTVTLLERPQGLPLEEALVYWPKGAQWVSAEPSKIAGWELQRVIDCALQRWNAL